jgi:hypothetical protein
VGLEPAADIYTSIPQTMDSVQRNIQQDVIAYLYHTSLQKYSSEFYYGDPYSVCGDSLVVSVYVVEGC